MSAGLVKHWRKLADRWRHCAVDLGSKGVSVTDVADCRARSQVYAKCADSLELSMKRAERKYRRTLGIKP